MKRKIVIKHGLLWEGDTSSNRNIVSVAEGDAIAQANDFMFVERLIAHYGEATIYIDENRKVI